MEHKPKRRRVCRDVWDAVWKDSAEELQRMLEEDPSLVHTTSEGPGWTLLGLASERGRVFCLKVLLKMGADQHQPTVRLETPFVDAVWQDHPSVVRLLYEHPSGGPELLRMRNCNGTLPVDLAKKHRDPAIRHYLLSKEEEARQWCEAIDKQLPPEVAGLVKGYYTGE